MSTYHITYTNRRTRKTETGRVGVAYRPESSTAIQRREAIQAAYFRYPDAVRTSISAVRCAR